MLIGVTGHQHIGAADARQWVRDTMSDTLSTLKPSMGYTSLAVGTDSLFAELCSRHRISYTVIIPSKNYESTFNADDVLEYRRLKSLAASEVELTYDSPSGEAFYAAGKRIVDSIDCLIAVWNGLPANGLGGTADVVKYAREQCKKIIHINPARHAIVEL
jgi:hypothetical protein